MDMDALHTPFLNYLDGHVVRCENDESELQLTVQPVHANLQGIAHGGVLATLLDTACGYSGLSDAEPTIKGASTISLSINYLSKARIGDLLTAHGWRTGGGRRIFFAQAKISNQNGDTIATASGAFRYASQR
ncbi:PaaI family thioesterase [Phytohalomonas tamaricis]|uniref:PaaI family thioesterase n=1 Tax=Phytohalomonas tamaricis TaxID=2081032 RepID=UPI000D0B1116|nr:PaaI family thioesterase [Phytohalomonas tamaricis]